MARPSGSPNKNKSFLLNRLQAMYGKDFHPIIKIAENCVELRVITPLTGDGKSSTEYTNQVLTWLSVPLLKSVNFCPVVAHSLEGNTDTAAPIPKAFSMLRLVRFMQPPLCGLWIKP